MNILEQFLVHEHVIAFRHRSGPFLATGCFFNLCWFCSKNTSHCNAVIQIKEL